MIKKAKVSPLFLVLMVLALVLAACAPQAQSSEAGESAVQPTAAQSSGEQAAATTAPAASESQPEAPAATESFYFVYVPKLVHPWYDDVKKGADTAIAELAKQGIEVKYDWDAPAQADVVQHTQRIEAAIAKNPDAIFVSCLDVAADTPLIEEAAKNGIPVIGFDTPCPGAPLTSFVGHEQYQADGADLAEVLAAELNYEGEIAILMGSPGAENHKQRVEGFKAAMAAYPNITIVAEEYDNDDLERAVNLTASMIQAHPNLKGLFGANASAPIGAGQAIVEAGKKGEIVLVGMDDLPEMVSYVKDGTAKAMSVQQVPAIGYWTIRYAVAMTNGHTLPVVNDTGSKVVTIEEVETYK